MIEQLQTTKIPYTPSMNNGWSKEGCLFDLLDTHTQASKHHTGLRQAGGVGRRLHHGGGKSEEQRPGDEEEEEDEDEERVGRESQWDTKAKGNEEGEEGRVRHCRNHEV